MQCSMSKMQSMQYLHSFTCSCTENIIKINICKNIHACAREFYNALIEKEDFSEVEVFNEHKTLLEIQPTPMKKITFILILIIS